jgi:hypothetical protein
VPALGGRTQDQDGAAWRSGPGAHLEKAISMCCAVSMEATRIHGFRVHIRASTGPAASEEVWKGKGREKRAKNRRDFQAPARREPRTNSDVKEKAQEKKSGEKEKSKGKEKGGKKRERGGQGRRFRW